MNAKLANQESSSRGPPPSVCANRRKSHQKSLLSVRKMPTVKFYAAVNHGLVPSTHRIRRGNHNYLVLVCARRKAKLIAIRVQATTGLLEPRP